MHAILYALSAQPGVKDWSQVALVSSQTVFAVVSLLLSGLRSVSSGLRRARSSHLSR